jgi:AcrR family transcriptional regulator
MSPVSPTAPHPTHRLRDRLREEAARAILEAAEAVFSEEGLSAGMERIADRAGVAVGTLYNHFQDRRALVDALSCTRREALFARLDAALAASEGAPFEAQLRAYLTALAEHGRLHGRLLGALVQAGEGPARVRPSGSILDGFLARAQALVDRGIDGGALRPERRGLLAPALVGLARAAMVRAVEGGATWDEVVDTVTDLFLRGAGR